MATIKGKKRGCSLKKDSKGWYVSTHRARSKSYASPDAIPEKDISFIESTGGSAIDGMEKLASLWDKKVRGLIAAKEYDKASKLYSQVMRNKPVREGKYWEIQHTKDIANNIKGKKKNRFFSRYATKDLSDDSLRASREGLARTSIRTKGSDVHEIRIKELSGLRKKILSAKENARKYLESTGGSAIDGMEKLALNARVSKILRENPTGTAAGILAALLLAKSGHSLYTDLETPLTIEDKYEDLNSSKLRAHAIRTRFERELANIKGVDIKHSKVKVDRSMIPFRNVYDVTVDAHDSDNEPMYDPDSLLSPFMFSVRGNKNARGIVDAIAVNPAKTRQGIAKSIIDSSDRAFKSLGIKHISLNPAFDGPLVWSKPYFGFSISPKRKNDFLGAYKKYCKEVGVEFKDLGDKPSNYPEEFLKDFDRYSRWSLHLMEYEKRASYSKGFEKLALNAQKAREMAKKVGLLPEGQWKWALRQLRGKSGKELADAKKKLGSLPNNIYQKVTGVSQRMGHQNEIGISINKGERIPNSKPGHDYNRIRELKREAVQNEDFERFKKLYDISLKGPYGKFGNRVNIGGRVGEVKKPSVSIYPDKDINVHTHPMFERNLTLKSLKDLKAMDRNTLNQGELKRLNDGIGTLGKLLKRQSRPSRGDISVMLPNKSYSIVAPHSMEENVSKLRPKGLREIYLDRTPRKALEKKAFEVEYTKDKSFKGDHERVNLRDKDNSLAAYMITRPDPAKRKDTTAISSLYVDPKYRGKGLAKKLLDIAKSKHSNLVLRAKPFKDKALGTDALKGLYGKHGFIPDSGVSKKEKSSKDIMFYKKASTTWKRYLEKLKH